MIFAYYGNSMKGIFCVADFIIFRKCNLKKLRKGDIVAFSKDQDDGKHDDPIVHRIICMADDHFFTKGDNNRRPDTFPVSESNLIGKVVGFERSGKTYKVRGGMAGLMQARAGYFIRRICYQSILAAKKVLFLKKISPVFSIFWKPRLKKVQFTYPKGAVIKWIYRDRTIAAWIPDKKLLKTTFLSRLLIGSKNLS